MAGLWNPILPANPTFAGGEASLADIYGAARENMVLVDNTIAAAAARERAYDDTIAEVMELTGEALENPYRVRAWPDAAELKRLNADRAAGVDTNLLDLRRRMFGEKLADLAARRPESREQLLKSADIEARALRTAREAGERLGEMAGSRDGLGKYMAAFAGGAEGSLRDPVQLYTLVAGGGPGAARTIGGRIVRTALTEALVNGVAEAAMQPAVQAWREKIGLPSGWREAMSNVGFATVLGGTFGAGIRGGAEVWNLLPKPIRAAVDGEAEAAPILEPIRDGLDAEARGALDAVEADRLSAPADDDAMTAALRRAEAPEELEPRPVEAPAESAVADHLARTGFDAQISETARRIGRDLWLYVGPGSPAINRTLREGVWPKNSIIAEADVRGAISTLDAAMSPIDVPVLYRALPARDMRAMTGRRIAELRTGDQFTDAGYQSTSRSRDIAMMHHKANSSEIAVLLEFNPGSSLRGLDLGGAEQEILLARGTPLEIAGPARNEDGVIILPVRPASPSPPRPIAAPKGIDDPADPAVAPAVDELIGGLKTAATVSENRARQRRLVAELAGPAPKAPPRPVSLVEWLAGEGIADFRGELKSLGERNIFVPGKGNLVRAGGRSLDMAREAAAEAGFLHGFGTNDEAVARSTVADLLTAIDKELRGEKVHARDDDELVADWRAHEAALADRAEIRGMVEELDRLADRAMPDGIVTAAARLMLDSRDEAGQVSIDAFDALESAVMADHYSEAGAARASKAGKELDEDGIPFFEGHERDGGPAAPPGRDQTGGPEGAPGTDRGQLRATGEGASRPATEPGAEGKDQLLIEGVAPVRQGDRDAAALARGAQAPLRGGNRELDYGLFGPERDQIDLLDLAGPDGSPPDRIVPSARPVDPPEGQPPTSSGEAAEPPPALPAMKPIDDFAGPAGSRTASWVIRERATGTVVMETFDRRKVAALNTEKYEAVPILEYLVSINGARPAGPDGSDLIVPVAVVRDADGNMVAETMTLDRAIEDADKLGEMAYLLRACKT